MINPIQYYRNNQKSPFELFHKQNPPKRCLKIWNISISKDSFTDKKNLFTIGLPTVIVVASCLMFSKGIQKNVGKVMDKFKNYLEYRLETNSLKAKGEFSNTCSNFMRGLNSLLNKTESINNITSLKDILFMKLMYKTKPTKAIHKSISDFFDKMSIKTVVKAYKNTEKAFQEMEKKFCYLDDYILKHSDKEKILYKGKEYSLKELLKLAKGYREEVCDTVKIFTSPSAQTKRNLYIKHVNSKLYKTFWDASFKDFATSKNKFKRKEMWQTFIAAEQMKGDKSHLSDNVAVIKNMISYTNEDKSIAISKLLTDLRKAIPRFDNDGYKQVKKLEWFAKNTEGLKSNKEVFLKELNKLTQQKEFKNADPEIIKNLQEQKNSYVRIITDMVNEEGSGQIQDLISIYYKIAPFEFSKSGALQSVKNAVKTFDKSVNLEISEYFDKVRDLVLGSAPTDVLTILLSTGLISHDLLKAKNNDEKTSVMLTSGIPLAGAVGTTIISTSKLVSGGKSLALGFASGIALNLIGKSVDKYRKKYFKTNKN